MKLTHSYKTQERILAELRKNPNLTVRGLGKSMGMKSTSAVWYQLLTLIAVGKIARGPKWVVLTDA